MFVIALQLVSIPVSGTLCTGAKAVDCLMESRWAVDPSSSEEYSPCIRSRKDAALYCDL